MQLDECSKAKPRLEIELELKAKLILELELRIKLQLETELKIRLELEGCRETKDKLQRELEECAAEGKVKLESELKVCKGRKRELQRQLEDTLEAVYELAEANEAATKAFEADKEKLMGELEELK